MAAASTFVYVAHADDGDIGVHALRRDGSLAQTGRVPAGKAVMPMAVSPDRRYLVAAARAQPFTAHGYAIDPATGALTPVGTGPLAESLPYITFDRTGRWLLGASYGGDLVSVNAVVAGCVGDVAHVVPTARHAHAIVVDKANRTVLVPHLGTDQVFQFAFDAGTGRLAAKTPPLLQLAANTGPRHIVFAPDERFVFLLSEFTATVTTFAYDAATGTLAQAGSASALPAATTLVTGAPRPTPGRNVDHDIWASDLHVTPDGRFVYVAERTGSTIGALRVDQGSGALTYLGSTPTEKQPRGFRIDPAGRYLVVAGEKSPMLSTYAIDAASGALALVGRYPTGRGSNWVEIVSFD